MGRSHVLQAIAFSTTKDDTVGPSFPTFDFAKAATDANNPAEVCSLLLIGAPFSLSVSHSLVLVDREVAGHTASHSQLEVSSP